MYRFLVFVLLVANFRTGAQDRHLVISLSYRPELVTSRDDISYRWRPHPERRHYNEGAAMALHYYFAKHFFATAGAGFVNRTFKTHVFFNQAAIPPPRMSFTQELVSAYPVSYRVFEFQLSIGSDVIINKKIDFIFDAGYVFDYLWSASYLPKPSRYAGVYAKRFWLGGSPNASAEFDFKISKALQLSSSVSYVFTDINKKDPYLFSQDEPIIAIKHHFTFLEIGLKNDSSKKPFSTFRH